MAAQQQVQMMSTEMRKASSCRSEEMAGLELTLAMAAPPAVQRQDSLYRAARANQHGQDSWAQMLHLVGVIRSS
jgi:hypothetical protein